MIRKDNKYMHPEIHKYWKSLGGAIEFWSNQDDGEIFFSIYFPEIKHHYSDVCIIQKDGTPEYSFPHVASLGYQSFSEEEALRIVKLEAFL